MEPATGFILMISLGWGYL